MFLPSSRGGPGHVPALRECTGSGLSLGGVPRRVLEEHSYIPKGDWPALDSTYLLQKIWRKPLFSSFPPYPLHNLPLLLSQPGHQTQPCHHPPSASISDSLQDRGGQDNPGSSALGAAVVGLGSGLEGAHLKDEEKCQLGAGSAPGGHQRWVWPRWPWTDAEPDPTVLSLHYPPSGSSPQIHPAFALAHSHAAPAGRQSPQPAHSPPRPPSPSSPLFSYFPAFTLPHVALGEPEDCTQREKLFFLDTNIQAFPRPLLLKRGGRTWTHNIRQEGLALSARKHSAPDTSSPAPGTPSSSHWQCRAGNHSAACLIPSSGETGGRA